MENNVRSMKLDKYEDLANLSYKTQCRDLEDKSDDFLLELLHTPGGITVGEIYDKLSDYCQSFGLILKYIDIKLMDGRRGQIEVDENGYENYKFETCS